MAGYTQKCAPYCMFARIFEIHKLRPHMIGTYLHIIGTKMDIAELNIWLENEQEVQYASTPQKSVNMIIFST